MERNRTVDGAISKRRRPPINRVLLVHEPAALADLRPATVNQCFYEHSLASTASLQPRPAEPTPPPTRRRPSLVSARTPTALPLCSPLPPPIRTHSRLVCSRCFATDYRRFAVSKCHRYIRALKSVDPRNADSCRSFAYTRPESLRVSRGGRREIHVPRVNADAWIIYLVCALIYDSPCIRSYNINSGRPI